MRKVRFGVIGLGRFGEIHCEALAHLPPCELYALCTRDESRLKELSGRFGVRHAYTSYEELLKNPEIDAVSVVTMWDQHAAPTVAALHSGKHVFVEKPMAATVAECEAIVRASRETGRFCMVGHICRFNPRYAAAKREIDAGAIGRIVSIYARRNIPAEVSKTVLTKIGPIMGDGIHDTDLMLWFTGAKIETAYAQTLSVRGLRYPDIGWTMYRFSGGAIGVCENVWFLPEKTPYRIDERMEVIGTGGALYIQETPASVSVCDREGWRSPDTTYWPMLHGERAGALRDELQYFANCILENREPTVITPPEALEAVRACLAAEQSAALGSPVAVV
ncbi:MAG TPA: Gfo/Idh/MocA family oxidoreductase [Bryobacteraceae bacterium]|nr:Gfo/Idh/MocA family oxidoreductase [Bryobacteraceae bacterium]